MYQVKTHHSHDVNPENIYSEVKTYTEAVSDMWAISRNWQSYSDGTIRRVRNRHEFYGNGYAMAAYIEKAS